MKKKDIKNLYGDNSDDFFCKMEAWLEGHHKADKLLQKKNKRERILQEYDDEDITREERDRDLSKIETSLYKLVDKTYVYIQEIIKEEETTITTKTSKLYELLCRLNFEHQANYFSNVLKESVFTAFVIRANKNYGQRWLYNRLITSYATENNIHLPKVLDLQKLKLNLIGIIDHLSKEMQMSNYNKEEPLSKKRIKFKNELANKLVTATQFIIIKNAYDFIHSSDFQNFCDMLNYFYQELGVLGHKHKCIFFFIENTSEVYEHKEHCVFSTEMKAFRARKQETFKFIDLAKNQPIQLSDLNKWLNEGGEMAENCLACHIQNDTTMKAFLKNCDQGHPDKVISAICAELGTDYENHKNQWLKY